jgi:hypothetical protein
MKLRRVAVLAVLATTTAAAACTAPPASRSVVTCIQMKHPDGLPSTFMKWNGVYGPQANMVQYTDSACATPVDFAPNAATVSSPPPPAPPAPYAQWWEVPFSMSDLTGTPAQTAAVAACSAMFGNLDGATVFAGYAYALAEQSGNLKADLWVCSAFDESTFPPTPVAP